MAQQNSIDLSQADRNYHLLLKWWLSAVSTKKIKKLKFLHEFAGLIQE